MPSSTLQERLALLFEINPRLSQAGLARACGISRPSVNAWLRGPTQSIDGKFLTTAAAYLGVDPEWLSIGGRELRIRGTEKLLEEIKDRLNPPESLGGPQTEKPIRPLDLVMQWEKAGGKILIEVKKEHPSADVTALFSVPDFGFSTTTPAVREELPSHFLVREPSNVGPAPALREQRRIPVRGEVKGGDDGFLEELSYATSDGFVESQSSDPEAYALRVRGDSMHPRYRAGEFIVVEPGIEAQPGDDVVVALKDGRKLLKELNWIRDGELQLLSINSNFGPLTLPLSEVLHIHLAAHRVRRNAFVKGP